MRYMMLIYGDESAPPDPAVFAAYGTFTEEVQKAGAMKAGDPLHQSSSATTVRVRDGKSLTTDGPFAETKEQLAGYYILECKDIDEAVTWAVKIPGARIGSIEVRPIREM